MAVEIIGNLSEYVSVLPPEIVDKIGGLIIVLKAVGVFAIIYVIYVVTMGILGLRSRKKMKVIERKVDVVNKKLDRLLKRKKK